MSATILRIERAASGQFKPGVSGNPGGRPKGARNRATILREALEAEGAAVEAAASLVRKAVEKALAGDSVLLRFLLSRLLPKAPERAIELALPAGSEADPRAIYQALLGATFAGEVAPGEALKATRLLLAGPRLERAAAPAPVAASGRPKPPTAPGQAPPLAGGIAPEPKAPVVAPRPPAAVAVAARTIARPATLRDQLLSETAQISRREDAQAVFDLYPRGLESRSVRAVG